MAELKLRGQHGMICIWPYQSVNIPLGRHRILLIARGKLSKDCRRVVPWKIQIEVIQLSFCCGRGQ